MYFDDFSFDNNLDVFIGKKINLNENGYLYGNMFIDEYVPYKNYKVYNFKPSTEEGKLKYKIMELTFIINDLNLYLDVHPNDQDMYEEFQKNIKKLNMNIDEYQNKYGSIKLNGESNSFDWTNSPWPWEGSY